MNLRLGIRTDRWFTAAAAAVAVLPVLVVIIEALASGWAPDGDRAVVATRAYDVLSAHPPLVGAFSTTTFLTGVNTYSPGPLLYWLLAVPAHLPGLWALPATVGLVNGASVIGTVLLARRRGGPVFMVLVAASLVVMLSSLATDLPNDIWAPSAPVLPFTLFVIVGWSVACGDAALLPLAVLLASFTAQCHTAYLIPGVLILAVAVGGLLVSSRAADPRSGSADRAEPVRRWAVISLIVGIVCWSLPLLDQIFGWLGRAGHGNLVHLAKAAGARGRTFGLGPGFHALIHTFGIAPWWMRRFLDAAPKVFDVLNPVSVLGVVSTAAFLVGLCTALVLGWRRRRLDVVAACAVVFVLIIAVAVFTASFPSGALLFGYGYTSWWMSAAGMWGWLLLGWSAVALLPQRRLARLPGRVVLATVTALALVAIPVLGLKTRAHLVPPQEYPAIRSLMSQVASRIPDRGPVLFVGRLFAFDQAVLFELRRKGLGVGSPVPQELGASYSPTGRRFAQALEFTGGTRLPAPGRVIARATMHTSPPRTGTVGLLYPSPARPTSAGR